MAAAEQLTLTQTEQHYIPAQGKRSFKWAKRATAIVASVAMATAGCGTGSASQEATTAPPAVSGAGGAAPEATQSGNADQTTAIEPLFLDPKFSLCARVDLDKTFKQLLEKIWGGTLPDCREDITFLGGDSANFEEGKRVLSAGITTTGQQDRDVQDAIKGEKAVPVPGVDAVCVGLVGSIVLTGPSQPTAILHFSNQEGLSLQDALGCEEGPSQDVLAAAAYLGAIAKQAA